MIHYWINKEYKIKKWSIRISGRRKSSSLGRFGGGWNWELGFQLGGSTLIINLLTFALIIRRK